MDGYNVLITGAFSGIGKEFVRASLKNPSNKILAIDRNFPLPWLPSSTMTKREFEIISNELRADEERYHKEVGDIKPYKVSIVGMDITNEVELENLGCRRSLKLVIHAAGVRGLEPAVPITQGSDVTRAEMMDVMTSQTMLSTYHINTVGTFLLLQRLIPSLSSNHGKAIIMGSRMGSIGHNSVGNGYAYRASKAALNAIIKSFSIDEPGVLFGIIHPGRVQSNLVGEGVIEDGAITAEESVNDMLQLISRLGKNDSGRLMDRFGEDIVW